MAKAPRNVWDELADELERNLRPHASYYAWESDPELAEEGVLADFVKAAEEQDGLTLKDARHRGRRYDPPDCEALGSAGERIGIELTELVHGPSIAAARRGDPEIWKDWRESLLPELQCRLDQKDTATPKGATYREYLLVIYTDEPWVGELDRIRRDVAAHVFRPTSLITRAYLLLSYCGWEHRQPCMRLNIKGRT